MCIRDSNTLPRLWAIKKILTPEENMLHIIELQTLQSLHIMIKKNTQPQNWVKYD